MEAQAHTEIPQHQQIIVPFGAVQEVRNPSKRKRKYVSPMQLLDLLWKTKQQHHGLTATEKATLSALITYVEFENIAYRGYESYPSTDLLIERSGNRKRTIEKNRNDLQSKDWMKVVSGRGKGHANHYFINGPKIVECYKLSYPEDRRDFRTGDFFKLVESSPSTIKRNTTGLMRGRVTSHAVRALVQ